MLIGLAELAGMAYRRKNTLVRWIRTGRLQAHRWAVRKMNWGWLTTLKAVRDAENEELSDGQKAANKVANELIREFELERVTWE